MAAGKKRPEEKKPDTSGIERSLRDRAEEQFVRSPKRSPDLAEQTPEQLIHELQVHQIELETQAEELRKANNALEESRNRFVDLYDFAPIGYLTLTDKALIADVNLAGATLLGVDRSRLVNTRFRTCIAQKDFEPWDRYFLNVLNREEKLTCTLTLKRHDGSAFPARLEGIRLTGVDGKIAIRIAFSDITDIWQIEALKESEQQFRQLFESASDAVFVLDMETTRIIDANSMASALYGYDHDVLLTMKGTEVSAEPEATLRAIDEAQKEPGQVLTIPLRLHRKKDGTVFPVEITARNITRGHKPVLLIACRDITERKRAEEALRVSEEKYRNILENIQDVFYRSDSQGNLIMISPSGASLLGYNSSDEMLGLSIAGRLYANPDDRAVFLEAMKEKGFVRDYEVNLRRKDGSVVTISTNSHFYYHTDGSIAGVEGILRDITERKRTEDALRVSERKFRAIFDQTFQFIGLLTPDGTLVEVNRTALKFSGITESDISGKPFWETPWWTHSGELQEKLRTAVQDAAKGEFVRFEATHPAADGSLHYIDFSIKPVMDEAGRVVLLIPEGRDITERKRAEDALMLSERRLSDIINFLPDATFAIDREGKVIAWNRAIEEMTGVAAREILGKGDHEYGIPFYGKKRPILIDLVFTDDEEIRNKYPHVEKKEDKFISEIFIQHLYGGKGAYLWFIASPLYDTKGNIIGAIESIRDITERKQTEDALKLSEQRLSDLVTFLPDATFAIDKAGRIITWNKAIEEMTGTKAGDMLGKGNYEYAIPFYGERRPILIDLIFEDLDTVESRYVHVQRSGNLLVAEASVPGTYQGKGAYLWGIASPLYDNEGNIVGAIESIRDINERKMAQDALDRTTKKLSLLNAVTFSDIQNAIFSLSGYFELEKPIPKDEKLQQYQDKQMAVIQKITESLKFANTYQGLGLKAPTWQNVLQSFLLGISHTDISKLSRTLTVEGLEIFADPQLENVFFTLAENIILHGKTATGISLSCRETDNGLVLVFEDNGEGISPEMKEKIFERKDVGTKGMGLFLAREILSITEITIRETGEPGKGARFEMTVPKRVWRMAGDDV